MLNSMADVITLDDLEFQLPLDGAGGPAGTTFRAARREGRARAPAVAAAH